MKRRNLAVGFSAAVLVVGSVVWSVLLSWDHVHFGREVDSYKNVPVYDNGILFWRGHGRHYSTGGYYYGQKWQCVEYVKRFYFDAKGHAMPVVWGHAKDFFDPSVEQGQLNRERGLIQFRNGGCTRPEPDDLIVFHDSAYGHVGIVTDVTINHVEMIQQNVFGRSRKVLRFEKQGDCFFITKPRVAAGWLRVPE